MPANLAEGQDADDIAVYIAKCAGNAHCGVTADAQRSARRRHDAARRRAAAAAAKPDGKAIFASAGCGGCHTLKAAGASGNVGPNLDDAEAVASRRSRSRSRTAAAACRPSRVS